MVLHYIVSCRDNSVVCCILIKLVVRTFCQPRVYITSTTNHGSILLKIPNHNTDTLNNLLLWQFWSTASFSLSTIHLKRLSKCVRQSFLCVSLDVFCPFLSAVPEVRSCFKQNTSWCSSVYGVLSKSQNAPVGWSSTGGARTLGNGGPDPAILDGRGSSEKASARKVIFLSVFHTDCLSFKLLQN